tara:strand:+ start:145 stop:633 length:489 start_codon:yes stop_codon:yes gene_type:complete
MDKIFKYLLNRNPTESERKNLINYNQQQINNYIVNLEEYQLFLNNTENKVNKLVIEKFGCLNKFYIHKLMNLLRNNHYNFNIIMLDIETQKNEINNQINNFIKPLFTIPTNINYSQFHKQFMLNNFNYKQIEFIIVNSNIFNNLVEKELDVFYQKNNINPSI